jgi:hypothetical protein
MEPDGGIADIAQEHLSQHIGACDAAHASLIGNVLLY